MVELIFPEPQNIQEPSLYHTLHFQDIQSDIENMEKTGLKSLNQNGNEIVLHVN